MEHEIQRWEHNYAALSARHRAILHHLPAKAAAARRATQQNQLFIKAVLYNFAGEEASDPQPDAGSDPACPAAAAEARASQQGGGVPDDLYSGAVKAADAMQAAGQQCPPGDAEKVGAGRFGTCCVSLCCTGSWYALRSICRGQPPPSCTAVGPAYMCIMCRGQTLQAAHSSAGDCSRWNCIDQQLGAGHVCHRSVVTCVVCLRPALCCAMLCFTGALCLEEPGA
jgi:hypothetical protein